jgi:hypothetical protein
MNDRQTERLGDDKRDVVIKKLRYLLFVISATLVLWTVITLYSATKNQLDFAFSIINLAFFLSAGAVGTVFISLILPVYTVRIVVVAPFLFLLFRYASGNASQMGHMKTVLWLSPFLALALSVPEYPLRRR